MFIYYIIPHTTANTTRLNVYGLLLKIIGTEHY